jgi:hypothetical protein
MPLQKLQFRPGVNREGTTLSNEGGWFDCDKVRFRSGFPEKIGGWAALSHTIFLGLCRSLWSWVTLNGYNLVGVGTNLKFYVEDGGAYYDITPNRTTTTNTTTFSATNGSAVITVTDTGITSLQSGDFVTFSSAASLGGNITAGVLNQEYQIQSVLTGTKYTVIAKKSGYSITGVPIAVNVETSTFSYPNDTTIANDNPIVLAPNVAPPTGLSYNTTYYIVNLDTSALTCQLSDTVGGDALVITSKGTGVQALYFIAVATASDSGNGGAATDATYQISTGSANSSQGTGWGAPPWGGYIPGGKSTTLNGALTAAATSMIVGNTTGFPTAPSTLLLGNAPSQMVETSLPSAALITGNITVLSTYGFSTTGAILIDTEIITYTGVTATTFTGCTRGASGSSAATHAKGAVVYQNKLENIAYAGITPTTAFTSLTRGNDGTSATTFATTSNVYDAASFPGWGEGYGSLSAILNFQIRLWSQANFGEYLLFAERGGAPYVWKPLGAGTPAFTTHGTLVSAESGAHEVPSNTYQILVSASSRITLAFGATSYSYDTPANTFDPMLIRWTNVESFVDWDPLTVVGSQAGSLRLSHGSQIIGALQTRQEILVWTDSALFSMQYIGYPYIWKTDLLADSISIMGPNAMTTASGVSYWMGTDKFYVYSGRVETLPCSLRQYVFDDINSQQSQQFFAGSNEGYSEVWWFYCSLTGPDGTGTASNPNTTIDRYVVFNYLDRVWYYGTLNRTAWIDSGLRPYPLAAAGDTNLLVYHEAAVDNGETNPPSAISSYIQSSDFDIGDGHNYGFVWRMIPDITFNGSQTTVNVNPSVDFVVRPRYNPGANYGYSNAPAVTSAQNYATQPTYNVQQFTQEVFTRIRGRQMAFRVECNAVGTQWQLGTPSIDIRPDGRR